MHTKALVLVLAVALSPRLAAQGGEKGRRSADMAPRVPPARTHLAPARGMLQTLIGTWRFEIWFAGNLGGDPDASGTRVVRALFDDLSLEWTEQLDHSEIRGQGVIGFDASADRFFSSSLYSAGPGAEFLAGLLDDAEPRITFTSLPLSAEPAPGTAPVRSAALMLLDRDHFTWTPLDHGWRAVFTRRP